MHLKTRICHLGSSINTRTEKHGDEDVAAIDIPITDFALGATELNSITGEPHAHRALFDKSKSPVEPIFRGFKAFALKDKFEDCTAELLLGLGREPLRLTGCKVARVKLEPLTGGMTGMDFLIQLTPDLAIMPTLMAHMGHEIELSIDVGKRVEKTDSRQQKLGLKEGEGEEDDE